MSQPVPPFWRLNGGDAADLLHIPVLNIERGQWCYSPGLFVKELSFTYPWGKIGDIHRSHSHSLSTLFTSKPKWTVVTEDQRKIVRQRIFSSSTFRSINMPEIFVSQIKISLYPREWREANSSSQHAAGVPGLVGASSPRYSCFVLQWCSSSAPGGLPWREIRQLVLMEKPKCQP